jgi:hypothetical protein
MDPLVGRGVQSWESNSQLTAVTDIGEQSREARPQPQVALLSFPPFDPAQDGCDDRRPLLHRLEPKRTLDSFAYARCP